MALICQACFGASREIGRGGHHGQAQIFVRVSSLRLQLGFFIIKNLTFILLNLNIIINRHVLVN
jgi:hypothetical protein